MRGKAKEVRLEVERGRDGGSGSIKVRGKKGE